MFDISPIQIMIVLGIALLIFGPKRLPEMGRNLGKGIRDFKGGLTGDGPEPAAHTYAPTAAQAEAVAAEPTPQELIDEASAPVHAHEDEPALAAASGEPTSTRSS